MNDKIIKLEEMKNMSIDKIIDMYRNGHTIENYSSNDVSNLNISNTSNSSNPSNPIYTMSPDVTVIYTRGYEQVGLKMTVDLLVRNYSPDNLVIKFAFYSTDATPQFLKDHIQCIPPYSTEGCTKVRVIDIPLKDPYTVRVYGCIDVPDCAVPSCMTFGTIMESTCTGSVTIWGGGIPPLSSFPPLGVDKCGGGALNMAVDCASCTPDWTCNKDEFGRNTGQKWNDCTQQTVDDIEMCPPPSIPNSIISITVDTASPFEKNSVVTFSGNLGSAIDPYPKIGNARLDITIKIGDATVISTYKTTIANPQQSTANWSYSWIVPASIAGVDTGGMPITVIVEFDGNFDYRPSSKTENYNVAGVMCSGVTVHLSSTNAKVGDKINLTAFVQPTGKSFPIRFKANNALVAPIPTGQQGHCPTLIAGGSSNVSSLAPIGTISIVGHPPTITPGQTIYVQVNFNIQNIGFVQPIKCRICIRQGDYIKEISWSMDIFSSLFGSTVAGTKTMTADIPNDISFGTTTIIAEITDDVLSICGQNLISQYSVNVNAIGYTPDTMVLLTRPSTVVAGQKLDCQISYDMTIPNPPDIVRFRICDDIGTELGHNDALMFWKHSKGIITVPINIPGQVGESIKLKAEVSLNQNSLCGQEVFLSTPPHMAYTAIQESNTIKIINLPHIVNPEQTIEFDIGYNMTVSDAGQNVRFRICSVATNSEIGSVITYLKGTSLGVVKVRLDIPAAAIGMYAIKAEVSLNPTNVNCGSETFISSPIANIQVVLLEPGTCSQIWNTTGWAPGKYIVTAEVFGQCVSAPQTLLLGLEPTAGNVYTNVKVTENTFTGRPLKDASVTILGNTKITDSNGIAGPWTLSTGIVYTFAVTKSGYFDYEQTFRYDMGMKITLGAALKSTIAPGCETLKCPDICIGNNLWSQKCQIVGETATCVQDQMQEPDSYECRSTNYIEYDLSAFPQIILDYVVADIIYVGDMLMSRLPSFGNIQYVGSTFKNGKFKVYVNYNPSLGTMSLGTISGMPEILGIPGISYNTPYNNYAYYDNNYIYYGNNGTILSSNYIYHDDNYIYNNDGSILQMQLPPLITLENFAILIVATLIILISVSFSLRVGSLLPIPPHLRAIGAIIIAGISIAIIKYVVYDVVLGKGISETTTEISPDKKIEIVREFVQTYARTACDDLHPTCVANPPTCSISDMAKWSECREALNIAQNTHDKTLQGTASDQEYADKIQDVLDTTVGIEDGTISLEDAKKKVEDDTGKTDAESTTIQDGMTCAKGQVYDIIQKKCVEECAIKNPITGECIISKGFASGAMMAGAALIGGLILMKFIPSKKK